MPPVCACFVGLIALSGITILGCARTGFESNPDTQGLPTVQVGPPNLLEMNLSARVEFPIGYSNAVAVDLDVPDIRQVSTDTANCRTTTVVNGTSFTPTVILADCTGDGTVRFEIAPGTSQNSEGQDTGTEPSVPVKVDNTGPVLTIGPPSLDEINSGQTVSFTLSISDAEVVRVDPADVAVETQGNTTCGSVEVIAGDGPNSTVNILGCSGMGRFAITVAGGTAGDTAGNVNLPAVSENVGVDLGSSLPTTSLGRPAQRKSFFEAVSGRHWGFHHESPEIRCARSADGQAWEPTGSLGYDSYDFAVSARDQRVFLVVTKPGNQQIVVRRGFLGPTEIAFDPEREVFNAAASENYSRPSVALDSSDHLWLVAVKSSVAGNTVQARQSTENVSGDLSLWEPETTLGRSHSFVESVIMLPRTGDDMFVVVNASAVTAFAYNGVGWSASVVGGESAWFSLGGIDGFEGDIRATLVWNGELHVGGRFRAAGGNPGADGIAKWDGATWTNLGSGLRLGSVNAMIADGDGNLYAAGSFYYAGEARFERIAQWNGTRWSALGDGLGWTVYALTIDAAGTLYAGGSFTRSGLITLENIGRWDGNSWSALGPGLDGEVRALAADNDGNIIVGGDFDNAGPVSLNKIAKWDGAVWSDMNGGMNDEVRAIACDNAGNVYAAGSFTSAGGTPAQRVAMWDGIGWQALDSGVLGVPTALALDDTGGLFVGGFMTGGNIARWDGLAWGLVGSGLEGLSAGVHTLEWLGPDRLFAGGSFRTAGGAPANRIAMWDGSSWSNLGSEHNTSVNALAPSAGSSFYAAGNFNAIGGVALERIALWDGGNWNPLGAGINGEVRCLADDGAGKLYAGGTFTTAGATGVNNIAMWDGANWNALGTGLNQAVFALVVESPTSLYAAGMFTIAGGSSANRVAKWDGANWTALGTGVDSTVHTMAMDGANNLYVGGYLSTAGGQSVDSVAMWDGATWNALGTGLPLGAVFSLAFDTGTGTLFAGGDFSDMLGIGVRYVAQWDGVSWSALGTAPDAPVRAMALDGGDLYVSGELTDIGGIDTRVAKWDGIGWTPLGATKNSSYGDVSALAVVNGKPVVGASGVYIWDSGAVADHAPTIAAAADPVDGDIWLALKGPTNEVQLRRYTTAWQAPMTLGTADTYSDVGVLFDSTNRLGMVLWSEDANLYKSDFDSSSVAPSPDLVSSNTHGKFSVGDVGDNTTFPLLNIDGARRIDYLRVQTDSP